MTTYQAFDVSFLPLPKEGCRTVQVFVQFPQTKFEVNFLALQQAAKFAAIHSFYCDNSNNTHPVTLFFPGTNQTVKVFAGSIGYYPVLATAIPRVIISSQGTANVEFQFLNWPCDTEVWKGLDVADGTPYFKAYLSSNFNYASATLTKVALDVEEFDSNSAFDPITARFTPKRRGKYLFTAQGVFNGGSAANNIFVVILRKNGVVSSQETFYKASGNVGGTVISGNISTIVDMNGDTDFVELWVFSDNVAPQLAGGAALTFMDAFFIGA